MRRDPNEPQYDDDGLGAIVTRQWPASLKPHRVTAFGLPKPIMLIGSTAAGIEARQKISDIPRGAYIEMEFRWLDDDAIETLCEFLYGRDEYRDSQTLDPLAAYCTWRSFLLSAGIKCLIPGWDTYAPFLPSQLWRIDLPGKELEGFPAKPSGCYGMDIDFRLTNLVSPLLPMGGAASSPVYQTNR
jgi:hypothetical protein